MRKRPANRRWIRQTLVAGILSMTVLVAAPSQAAVAPPDEGLPNVDRRGAKRLSAPAPTRAARRALAADLGPLGEVRTDRESGGVSYVGRSDGLLTGPSSRGPREIVLDYVRTHQAVFGLNERDITNLQLVARSVSPDGIVHLRFNQTLDGIWSFDSGIDGHVTADGRLINVSGTPIPGAHLPEVDPTLSARTGLRKARQAIDGPTRLPATTKALATPERTTTFAGGERAVLRWSPTAEGVRLAWSVIADDGNDGLYDVLVDADRGTLLRRQDLTSHLGEALYFGADPLRTPDPIKVEMPSEWYDDHAGGTRLWGQYSRTYADPDDENPQPGDELGGNRIQIHASSGGPAAPDWLYPQSTDFPDAPSNKCPSSGCTWNVGNYYSRAVNRSQAATNAHVLVSRFHDYLFEPPIGFDEASGNFQRTNFNGEGVGNDYVRTEVNDGSGANNANFSTPPDGQAPRMQMYLYYSPYLVNGSDAADVVYHEYTHGLSNRLVVNAAGSSALTSRQATMMGEAWSDFYSLDFLVGEHRISDTAAAGEVARGIYTSGPGGSRTKSIDCPVDPAGTTATCNPRAGAGDPAVLGGYTYGDLAVTFNGTASNPAPHNGGEIWSQTLWDIRTELGRETTLALVTGGMRLAVDDPSMLDMRDAILQQAIATRSAPGAADDHSDALLKIFARRGMGVDASTTSSQSTTPTEGFGLVFAAAYPTLSDPYPGGDNDGLIEPGERVEIRQPLAAVTQADVTSISGTLTAGQGAIAESGSVTWPTLGGGRQESNSTPLAVRLPSQCTFIPLTINLTTSEGPSKARVAIEAPDGGATAAPRLTCDGRLEIPKAQSDPATAIDQGSAAISGAVTPNGRATGMRFVYGTTAAYGSTSAVTNIGDGDGPVSSSLPLTGLQPGTTYHYAIEAIREGAVAVTSADRTFMTLSPPVINPPGFDPPTFDPPRFDPPVIDPPVGDPPTIDPPVIKPPGSTPRTVKPRPKISKARVKLTRAGKHKNRRRASFSFRVSEPVKVTAVVTRGTRGIRKGKRCVAVPKRRPHKAKSCTRQRSVTKRSVRLRTKGRGRLRLPTAGLRKGRYTAKLTAVDAAHKRSKPVVVRFRVK